MSSSKSFKGQSVLEYLLMLGAVVGAIVLALGPSGIITKSTSSSLDKSLECLNQMAKCVCYQTSDGEPCPPICGNGCCESGEPSSCLQDCEGCGGMGAQVFEKCPNGKCEGSETCVTCPNDCGTCVGVTGCGDGFCDPATESCSGCAFDCGPCF